MQKCRPALNARCWLFGRFRFNRFGSLNCWISVRCTEHAKDRPSLPDLLAAHFDIFLEHASGELYGALITEKFLHRGADHLRFIS